jgi:hypothetical protein
MTGRRPLSLARAFGHARRRVASDLCQISRTTPQQPRDFSRKPNTNASKYGLIMMEHPLRSHWCRHHAGEVTYQRRINKMPVKPYIALCGAFLAAALLLFITGNFTMMTAVVFGFIAFGLTFLGMMNVLPVAVSHAAPVEPPKKPVADTEVSPVKVPVGSLSTWKSA